MKQRKSDILWKRIMEQVFAHLLRFIFPDADQVYNMERGFEYLDKELAEMDPQPDEEKDTRFADKLVKVFHRDGEEEWVLLHIEIQGDTSKRLEFSERMFEYFYRIRDRHHKPVSALAIFTGQDGKDMPRRYFYEYRETRLTYEYPTLSILDFSDEELDKSDNPFAQVVVAAKLRLLEGKIPDEDLLEFKLVAANKLQEKGFDEAIIQAIFVFLRNHVLFEEPEMNRKFDERFELNDKYSVMNMIEYERMDAKEEGLAEGLAKGRTEGKEEGLAEGRTEGLAAAVKHMMATTELSDEKIASLVGVSVDFVNEIRQENKK
jgi:predicted transposase YdaD